MKKQIFVIHGGTAFSSYGDYFKYLSEINIDFERFLKDEKDWKNSLKDNISPDLDVISPKMPCKQNAKYSEWKIYFEKFIPYLKDDIVFIGHSLGGTFLAKYLSENDFPKKIKATFLVAPAFSEENESLGDFIPFRDFSKFEKQGGKIFIYGSSDDPVVPPIDFEEYAKNIPSAINRKFKDKGHFNMENLPELISDIENL